MENKALNPDLDCKLHLKIMVLQKNNIVVSEFIQNNILLSWFILSHKNSNKTPMNAQK